MNTVHGPANNQYLSIFGTIFRNRCDCFLINVNPTFLKLIILSRFILLEKYDNISENAMLKKFEVRHKYLLLCAQAYVHAQRTPLF